MQNKSKFKKNLENWLYDHHWVKTSGDYFIAIIVSTFSALIFALAINVFVIPEKLIATADNVARLATGGASGLSQDITLLMSIIFGNIDTNLLYSVLYFVVNIPLIVISFLKIGKRFTILTLINVLESSIFISLFDSNDVEWVYIASKYVNDNGGALARVIFGGIFVGMSSALPFKFDFSAGGMDILCYLISLRKGNNTGRYTVTFNTIVIALFCILTAISSDGTSNIVHAFMPAIYCILYLFVCSLVIDSIHIRNKKCELKVITENPDLVDLLLSTVPHGATISKGTGAYTGKEKTIITMVVSSNEVKKISATIMKCDENAFIEVYTIHNIFGNFYIKPIK